MIGTTELLVIAVIIFVLFGATAIPKFAKSLGEAKKAYKEAAKEENNEKKECENCSKKEDEKVEK
jgi:sec-independent protein translocase protein TatA